MRMEAHWTDNLDQCWSITGLYVVDGHCIGKISDALSEMISEKNQIHGPRRKCGTQKTHRSSNISIECAHTHTHSYVPVSIPIALKCVFFGLFFFLFLVRSIFLGFDVVSLVLRCRLVCAMFSLPFLRLAHICVNVFVFLHFHSVAKHSNEWHPPPITPAAPPSVASHTIQYWFYTFLLDSSFVYNSVCVRVRHSVCMFDAICTALCVHTWNKNRCLHTSCRIHSITHIHAQQNNTVCFHHRNMKLSVRIDKNFPFSVTHAHTSHMDIGRGSTVTLNTSTGTGT